MLFPLSTRLFTSVLLTAGILGTATQLVTPTIPTARAQGTVEALECPGVLPTDPGLNPPSEPEVVALEQAHRIATGRDVTIAIIDTGVTPHPRLPELIPGGDLVGAHQQDGTPGEFIDCDGHGTVIAGIIAMRPDHGSGWPYDGSGDAHVGIAPEANLIAIKQTSAFVRRSGDTGVGTLGTLADSIHRAIDTGANIINISVVSCIPEGHLHDQAVTPLDEALLRAEYEGILIVAAAGNIGQDCPAGSTVYPAHSDTVLAVSARFDPHTIATYSVAADQQLLSAQGLIPAGLSPRGEGFVSAMLLPSGESPFEGTSFAAPVVSGTAALIKQRYPLASPQEIRERILASVDPARGAVDPYQALTFEPYRAAPPTHEVVVATPTPPDTTAVERATLILISMAVVTALILITTGWWHLSVVRRPDQRVMPNQVKNSSAHGRVP